MTSLELQIIEDGSVNYITRIRLNKKDAETLSYLSQGKIIYAEDLRGFKNKIRDYIKNLTQLRTVSLSKEDGFPFPEEE